MQGLNILIVGGGIGGLTAAIALGQSGQHCTVIEKEPEWRIYGVGITQQSNVVRAMAALGVIEDYLAAGFGYDAVEVFAPNGQRVARIPSPKLVPDLPANVGIGRRALHEVLLRRALQAGAPLRQGLTADRIDDDGAGVTVSFSDGTSARYDLVVGADGIYSQTRRLLFPDAPEPCFTGQSVWRHNFPRPEGMDCLQAYEGPLGLGFAPLDATQMYMFLVTAEPGNPHHPADSLADAMRGKLAGAPPQVAALAATITDSAQVVYRPLETVFVDGEWHKGRVALLGDAVHATTPHLGQGAGMAIEDAIVLAEELASQVAVESALAAWHARRFDRCRYIVETSLALGHSQMGTGPAMEQAETTRAMFAVVAQPL